jgi:hypothetical protein
MVLACADGLTNQRRLVNRVHPIPGAIMHDLHPVLTKSGKDPRGTC